MTNETIKVRQKQYAIAKAGMSITTLETQDISTCTGLVGWNRSQKVAFMAHLDTPFSVLGLQRLADELKAGGLEFSDFELFKVAGMDPIVSRLGLVLALSVLYFQPGRDCKDFLFLLLFALLMWAMSGLTRASLWLQLWRLGASSTRPPFCGVPQKAKWKLNLFCKRNVTFNLEKDPEPQVSEHLRKRNPRFDVEYLTKADGSA